MYGELDEYLSYGARYKWVLTQQILNFLTETRLQLEILRKLVVVVTHKHNNYFSTSPIQHIIQFTHWRH